jgi:hypothetical protein
MLLKNPIPMPTCSIQEKISFDSLFMFFSQFLLLVDFRFDSDTFILLFCPVSDNFFLVLVLNGFRVAWRWLVFCLLVLLFFVFMSGLDFVVHRVLYSYGLRFSYD